MLAYIAALYDEVSLALRRGKFERVRLPGGALSYEAGPRSMPAHARTTPAGHGADVMVVVTGWGAAAAEKGGRWAARELRPSAIVAVGYSGGTRPGVAAGTVVIGEQAVQLTANAVSGSLPADKGLLGIAHSSAQTLRMPVAAGVVGTTPKIVSNPMDKAALGAATGALAIDLETWHFARAAADAGIPFLAVRAIVDAADRELPGFVDRLAPGPRPPAALPALRYVIGSPWRVGGVVRTGLAAGRARHALARFMSEFSGRWQGSAPASSPSPGVSAAR